MQFYQPPFICNRGKFNILHKILKLFPENIKYFMDIFSGTSSVGLNVKAETVVCLDSNIRIINLLSWLKASGINETIHVLESIVNEYHLSRDIGENLIKINKEFYNTLKDEYNQLPDKDDFYANMMLLVLLAYNFNNQLRFKDGLYNVPIGNRSFSNSYSNKVRYFCNYVKDKNIHFIDKDFRDIGVETLNSNVFTYADPPVNFRYYNEQNTWTEQDDSDLFSFFNKINEKGLPFALSNVLEYKGNKNQNLYDWMEKYGYHYNIVSKRGDKIEVVVRNYKL